MPRRPRPARTRARTTAERSVIEQASIAVCRAVYGVNCPCARAPSVCESMRSAARAVLAVAAPEVLVEIDAAARAAHGGVA